MAHAYQRVHRGSLAELPVFSHDKKKPQHISHDALLDRLQLQGLSEQHPLPATNLKNNRMLDNSADYYHCGGKRSSSTKTTRNLSAPKPRPPAASIVNEASRRVNSMRILSTTQPLSGEGLPLNWRDDNHHSLSKPKRGMGGTSVLGARQPRPPFNVDSSVDTSVSFSNELIPATKSKPPPRQPSPSSNKAKAAFKYLSAKMVAEKLVKALTKDRASTHEDDANKKQEHSTDAQRGASIAQQNALNVDFETNGSIDSHIANGHLGALDRQPNRPNGGNGYPGSPPRDSIEYEERHDISSYETRLTKAHIINHTSEEASFYDPLEARARAYEEQATMLGTGNELSDVLIRTLVHDGDYQYDTLEIHIDVLQKEFRKHIEDKKDLALKMAAELRARLSERARAEEVLKRARLEMEDKVRMMEREKVEMKSRLQEEMEENETQWVSKYEKLKSKERRLHERLKEILEEKVELHKEVSALTTKKNALVEEVQGYQEGIQRFKEKAEEASQETVKLQKVLAESLRRSSERDGEDKVAVPEEESNKLARRYRHKDREVMEKQKVVGKLQKQCKEQEKTIAGLRFALGEQANNAQMQGKGEFFVKLQRELVRLSGIEQGLRREVESYKTQALAANRENASLAERLGTIMRKLGNVALGLADPDEVDPDQPLVTKPCGRQDKDGSIMRVEEIDDEQEAGLLELRTGGCNNNNVYDNGNDDMAIVLLGHSPNSANTDMLDVVAKCSKMSEAHDLITSRFELHCEEREELEKLQEDVGNLAQTKDRLQEEASNLHSALSLTNRRVHELEAQLASKEEKLGNMEEELGRVREQKDNVQKEADFMGREAIRLSAQVDRLRRKIERLDEDVMVKDGQLSILRGALHENSQ